MPRSRDISHYPQEYFTATEAAGFRNEMTRVVVADFRMARKLRGNYYAFVGQLKKRQHDLSLQSKLVPLTADDQHLVDLAQAANRVLVTFEDHEGVPVGAMEEKPGRITVVWQNRDQSWQAQAMKGAVTARGEGAAVPPVPQAILDAMKDADNGGKK